MARHHLADLADPWPKDNGKLIPCKHIGKRRSEAYCRAQESVEISQNPDNFRAVKKSARQYYRNQETIVIRQVARKFSASEGKLMKLV